MQQKIRTRKQLRLATLLHIRLISETDDCYLQLTMRKLTLNRELNLVTPMPHAVRGSNRSIFATVPVDLETERIDHGSTLSKPFRTAEQPISFFDEAQICSHESHQRGYKVPSW